MCESDDVPVAESVTELEVDVLTVAELVDVSVADPVWLRDFVDDADGVGVGVGEPLDDGVRL